MFIASSNRVQHNHQGFGQPAQCHLVSGQTEMGESTLKCDTCTNSTCKIQVTFGSRHKLSLNLLNFPKLKYEITVTNTSTRKASKFSTEFCNSQGGIFNVPLEDIGGHPADLFDIEVDVFRPRHGDGNAVHFTNIKLMQYERILQNRLVKTGTTATYYFCYN